MSPAPRTEPPAVAGNRLRPDPDWRPAASLEALRLRATLLARIRGYFARQGVLEVDTPALSVAGATDPALSSFRTAWHGPAVDGQGPLYLHTSPEFSMKRLLAAGSGSIYQICKVFRDGEAGRHHNPEFTLLEWYRTGFDHLDLMDEVERLLVEVLAGIAPIETVHHWTYRELFRELAGVDPLDEVEWETRDASITNCDLSTGEGGRGGNGGEGGLGQPDPWHNRPVRSVVPNGK